MDSILAFLNQPIVLTLITLIVGSYLLNLVAERRSRRDKLRDQAIDFLTDASNYIGAIAPNIYAHLRTGKMETSPEMFEGLKDLFTRRMSIQVGSQAYLESETFYLKYFRLMGEFPGVIESLRALEQGEDAAGVMQRAKEHIERLQVQWPLEGEAIHPQTGEPVDALILWMDLVMHRMTDLITSHLEKAMR
ncbi:MAG: hypothetical protein P8046_07505 [Anaerolineales bacterium]